MQLIFQKEHFIEWFHNVSQENRTRAATDQQIDSTVFIYRKISNYDTNINFSEAYFEHLSGACSL